MVSKRLLSSGRGRFHVWMLTRVRAKRSVRVVVERPVERQSLDAVIVAVDLLEAWPARAVRELVFVDRFAGGRTCTCVMALFFRLCVMRAHDRGGR